MAKKRPPKQAKRKATTKRPTVLKMELKTVKTETKTLIARNRRNSLVAWCELYMQLEGCAGSDNTTKAKTRDLQGFLEFFLEVTGADQNDQWTRSITTDYMKFMERKKHWKPSTINRKLSTLKHTSNWIQQQRSFLAGNPTERVAELDIDDPEWQGLTEIQRTRARSAAEQLLHLKRRKNQRPYRDFAICEVLFGTALRVSELTGLRLDQFDGKHFRDVKRKGNKRTKKVFMTREAREALSQYIEQERGRDPGPVFQSKTGNALDRTNVEDVLLAVQNQANAQLADDQKFSFSPHTLRHTCLRQMARKHGVEFALEQSGQTSGRYIWRYVQPSDDEKQKAMDELY